MRLTVLFVVALVALVGCGNRAEPSAPTQAASATPPASAAAPATSATAPAEPADPPKPRKPFELYNSCTKVVTVIVGKDPKASDAGRRTAAPSSSIELPRDAAGNQVVWLVDEKGEPTTHVTVTRGINRVEVGRSCSTLNAN